MENKIQKGTERKMKHIANTLTISRIFLALILLIFFKKISVLFLIIYTVAEFTDMIDGTIARKTNSCSAKGALLDTVADLLLNASLVKILFTMKIMTKKLSAWMFIALGIGIISPIINFIKHKKIFFIHSIPCKISGGLLTLVPFAIHFGFITPYLIFMLNLITLSMIEIVIMSILLKEPDPNAASIYEITRRNESELEYIII
jgi:CDP-diacylglycerol--glycerol-3-phosphate 3-phosphatidyltransferase